MKSYLISLLTFWLGVAFGSIAEETNGVALIPVIILTVFTLIWLFVFAWQNL